MAWHEGKRDRQTKLGRLWDKVTGQDKLKTQIESLQEHASERHHEMIDLGYQIQFRDDEIKKLQASPKALDQVVQEATATPSQEVEHELER